MTAVIPFVLGELSLAAAPVTEASEEGVAEAATDLVSVTTLPETTLVTTGGTELASED